MIRPVSSVSFNGTKNLGAQKVARKVVNANKQAPNGVAKTPMRCYGSKDSLTYIKEELKTYFDALKEDPRSAESPFLYGALLGIYHLGAATGTAGITLGPTIILNRTFS